MSSSLRRCRRSGRLIMRGRGPLRLAGCGIEHFRYGIPITDILVSEHTFEAAVAYAGCEEDIYDTRKLYSGLKDWRLLRSWIR